ncbi:MAG: hypothetical protein M3N19_06195 [Candidatus Eremiobacteraeota bacterium]|nr:hypothetical protein [Candidatus Eremiobacteraeota bacterium]
MKQPRRNAATEEAILKQNPAEQRNYHCGRCRLLRMTWAEYQAHQIASHEAKK